MKNKFIKVLYVNIPNAREIGWVEKYKHGYKVANVPMCPDLNIDDIVEIEKSKDDFPLITNIKEIQFQSKTMFGYKEIADFRQLDKEFSNLGGKVEGFKVPEVIDGKYFDGVAVLASNLDKTEIKKILKKYGAKIFNHEKRKKART